MRFYVVRNRFFPIGYKGIVLWPFVFLKPMWKGREFNTAHDKVLFRHELQHCYQIHEQGVLKFYFMYLINLFRKGYKRHPMEIDAKKVENIPLSSQEAVWFESGKIDLKGLEL